MVVCAAVDEGGSVASVLEEEDDADVNVDDFECVVGELVDNCMRIVDVFVIVDFGVLDTGVAPKTARLKCIQINQQ